MKNNQVKYVHNEKKIFEKLPSEKIYLQDKFRYFL